MIFISYAHEDTARVRALVECLESAGYDVVWDAEFLGRNGLSDEVKGAIDGASRVVVVWTTASVKSKWVEAEASRAMEASKCLQVRLDAVELPLPFDRWKWFDLLSWDEHSRSEHPGYGEFFAALSGRQDTPPPIVKDVLDPEPNIKDPPIPWQHWADRLRPAVFTALVASVLVASGALVTSEWGRKTPHGTDASGGAAPAPGGSPSSFPVAVGGREEPTTPADTAAAGRGGTADAGAAKRTPGAASTGGHPPPLPPKLRCCDEHGMRKECAKSACDECGYSACRKEREKEGQ
jgi:hypothetical protein